MSDHQALALLVGGLTAANIARTAWVPGQWHLAFNLALLVFAALVAVAAGLSWSDLGLDREQMGSGARYGGIAFAVVTVGVVALGLAGQLGDDRTEVSLAAMLVRVLVVIPLATVVMEELAFRGTLHGLFQRVGGPALVWAGGAVLFGLWHVFPAWRSDSSVALALGTLVATTAAGVVFIWLRTRSDSLVAPMLAHLATNSVTFALAWLWR